MRDVTHVVGESEGDERAFGAVTCKQIHCMHTAGSRVTVLVTRVVCSAGWLARAGCGRGLSSIRPDDVSTCPLSYGARREAGAAVEVVSELLKRRKA